MPLKRTNPIIKVQDSKEMLDQMQQKIDHIRMEIKATQDRHKSYDDLKRIDCSFEIGDMVFLKILPDKSSLSLGRFRKLIVHLLLFRTTLSRFFKVKLNKKAVNSVFLAYKFTPSLS